MRKELKNNFTLIELLVALGIFSIIVMVVIQVFSLSQSARRSIEGITRVHESARVIFDLIDNDLSHAVALEDHHRTIPFAIVKGEDGSGPFPYMVSQVASTEESRSRLAEVTYDIGPSAGKEDFGGNEVNYFRRSVTCDYKSSGSSNKDWDFYGKDDMDWTKTNSEFHAVAPGVLSIKFQYRYIEVENDDYNDAVKIGKRVKTKYFMMPTNKTTNYLPKVVDVELSLYDPVTEGANSATKTKRTFFKRFFIKQGTRFIKPYGTN